MRKGLVLGMVLLLLATAWTPMASAQGGTTGALAGVGELRPYGRGYVESLVLYSGAGVGLACAPSFGGNATALNARLAELAAAVNGSMPVNATPVMLPFASANPALSGLAPLDHSRPWQWNVTAVVPQVDLDALGSTLVAETELAGMLLEGTHDGRPGASPNDAGEGVLLLLAATEAVSYMAQQLGWNGTAMVALNLSDPNMTDQDASNGYWLPAGSVTGTLNMSMTPPGWTPATATAPVLDDVVQILRGAARLYGLLAGREGLVGPTAPFPNGTRDTVAAFTDALYWNMLAVFYGNATQVGPSWFHEASGLTGVGTISRLCIAMDEVLAARGSDSTGADAKVKMGEVAHTILDLQFADGSMRSGYTFAVDHIRPSPAMAPIEGQAWSVAALYTMHIALGGVIYGEAAELCLRALDIADWNATMRMYLPDPTATSPTILTSDEVAAFAALVRAVDTGVVEVAKYRISELWGGMKAAGLQLSETNTTGENYAVAGNDTDRDGIMKHSVARPGQPFGVAPVLASGASYDNRTGNWTLLQGGAVLTRTLMDAAFAFLPINDLWAEGMGAPKTSEETARMLLHLTDEQLANWMDARVVEIESLKAQVASMQVTVGNATAEVAALRANVSKLLLDLNESRENVTVLNTSVNWLRDRLEQANDTVDNLTKQIGVLDDKISRIQKDVDYRGENVTSLEGQLRSERENVTQLQWKLDNATADLTDAQRDLKVAQDTAKRTQNDMNAQEDRAVMVAALAFVAGFVIAIIIVFLSRRYR